MKNVLPAIFLSCFVCHSVFSLELTRSAGFATNDASVGSVSWSNPGYVYTYNDGFFASASLNCSETRYLKATNFGFSLPSNYVINGISADIRVSKSSSTGTMTFLNVRIVKADGTIGWFEMDGGGGWMWGTAFVYSSIATNGYGSCNDDWGESGYWTPARVNDPDFGVAFSVGEFGCSGAVSARVDHVKITVCYTAAAPVELISFEAIEMQDNKVEVSWEISVGAHEALSFSVERGADALLFSPVSAPEKILSHPEAGRFSFVDEKPVSGTSFYRLKIFGPDGTELYSAITEVSIKNIQPASVVNVFPNPVLQKSGLVNISFRISEDEREPVRLRIFNLSGELVYAKELGFLASGSYEENIVLGSILPGAYVVRLNFDGSEKTQRMQVY